MRLVHVSRARVGADDFTVRHNIADAILKLTNESTEIERALARGGETGALLLSRGLPDPDLATPQCWPELFCTLVSTILLSQIPALIVWGPRLTSIYNDAYIRFLGDKHPEAFGKPYNEIWAEIWPQLEPIVAKGWVGKPTFAENAHFEVKRHGYLEPLWATFSYSPVFDDGKVVGALALAVETTDQVQAQSRQSFQLAIADRMRGISNPDELANAACELLGGYMHGANAYYTEIDEAADCFRILANWTQSGMSAAGYTGQLSASGPSVLDTLRAGKPLAVSDIYSDVRTASHLSVFSGGKTRSLLAIPLLKAGRFAAGLTVTRSEPTVWSQYDIAVAEDVAERTWNAVRRARAEAALEAERDRSRLVLENLDEGFVLMDKLFRVIQCNAMALHMESRPASEIIGRSHWELWPGSEDSGLGAIYKHAMASRQPFRLEHFFVYPDGRGFWIDTHGYPFEEGLALFFRDVTQRKQAEEALRNTAAHLRFTLESAEIGDWEVDLTSGRVVYHSLRHDQCLGYTQPIPDWTAARFFERLHPEDRGWVREKTRQMIQTMSDAHFECRVIWPDGSVHWISSHAHIHQAHGKPLRMSGIISDVTERKVLEQQRHEAIRHLQLAVDIAHLGSWEWDLASGECYFSPLWKQQIGYEAHELSDRLDEWESRLHPEDRPWLLIDLAERASHAANGLKVEYRLQHRSGEYRWMVANAVSVINGTPGSLKLAGTQLDITETKLADQRVLAAAQHDPLTGLPNRALVFEYAGHMLAAARRNHVHGAFLFIDLDRFKPINDLYGHHVGDMLLKEAAARLAGCVRSEDLVARLGGDEFLIVLQHGAHAVPAVNVAGHVLESLARPFEIESLSLSISASIGISYFPQHGTDVDELVHAADLAMYHSKHQGRGGCHAFTPELVDRAEASSAIEARLKRALHDDGLTLHYQPVIDMKTRRVIGAEALLRLGDGEGGLISPEQFIVIAESAGLIAQLGEWVVREACRQLVRWQREGLPQVAVAVNVSPLQFRQRGFAERLQAIVQDAGVDPSLIQIEVTESTVMDSVDDAVQTLGRIRDAGIRIALDDFGTGYSSLSHLSSLPLDKLKVDQSFVRRLEHDKASRAITEAIIALGRTLKLEVVGEGIESAQALSYLQEHGCNQAQGYFISRPLPAEEFAHWHRHQGSPILH